MAKTYHELLQGYAKFQSDQLPMHQSNFENLVEHGQVPEVLFITCCDSRIEPALLLQSNPGDLFVIRNVANIVPAYQPEAESVVDSTIAAMQYAVVALKVKHIVIMGHSQCGGIASLLATNPAFEDTLLNVSQWMKNVDFNALQSGIQSFDTLLPAEKALCCERLSVMQSVKNCQEYPWIKSAVASNALMIHGWHVDLKTGSIYYGDTNAKFHCLRQFNAA